MGAYALHWFGCFAHWVWVLGLLDFSYFDSQWICVLCALGLGGVCIWLGCFVYWVWVLCGFVSGSLHIAFGCFMHWVSVLVVLVLGSLGLYAWVIGFGYSTHWVWGFAH